MLNGFDKTMSDLSEEMIESLPPSDRQKEGKRERIKAAAYFLCKNGFKHLRIGPEGMLILEREEGALFAAKMTRPLSKDEPFDEKLIKEFTKAADKFGIPRENQILLLVEGEITKGNKAPLLQNTINPDFTLSFIYSGMFLEDAGVCSLEDFENVHLKINWFDCMEYRFFKKMIHLTDRTWELMQSE